MNDAKIEGIIDEVLFLRRMSRSSPDSCFVVNEASHDLRQIGDEALPDIEYAIRTLIVLESADHNVLDQQYPGLLSLWMAYFSISSKTQIERAVAFLRLLDGPMLIVAIQAVGATWARKNSKAPIPTPLLKFLTLIANQTSNGASDTAKHLLMRTRTKEV